MEQGFVAVIAALQDTARAALPAQPPIQQEGWTVWLPGLAFLILASSVWAFWRHFADKDD